MFTYVSCIACFTVSNMLYNQMLYSAYIKKVGEVVGSVLRGASLETWGTRSFKKHPSWILGDESLYILYCTCIVYESKSNTIHRRYVK